MYSLFHPDAPYEHLGLRAAPKPAWQALDCSPATTCGVNYGSAASLDNLQQSAVSLVAWFKLITDSGGGILCKGVSTGGGSRCALETLFSSGVYDHVLQGTVDCATTDALSRSSNGTIVEDIWSFVVMTYTSAAKVLSLFYGTEFATIKEVSYQSQANGVGAEGDNSTRNQFAGLFGAGTSGGLQGILGALQIYDRVTTPQEMQDLQEGLFWLPGCVLWSYPGMGGLGTQRDYSGRANHGTIVSTPRAVADFPLWMVPRSPPRLWTISIPAGTQFQQSVSGAITPAGALIREARTAKTGAFTSTGILIKETQTAKVGSTTPTGSLTKETQTAKVGTLSFAGALAASKVVLRTLEGTLTSSGALVKQTYRSFIGTLTSSGTLTKHTPRSLSGTLSFVGILAASKVVLKAIEGTLTSSGALTKRTFKSFAGTINPVNLDGDFTKVVYRSLTGTLTSSGLVQGIRTILKSVDGSLSFGGVLARQTQKSLGGGLSSSGTLSKLTSRSLVGVLSAAGTLAKQVQKALSGVLSFLGDLIKSLIPAASKPGYVVEFTLSTSSMVFSVDVSTMEFEVQATPVSMFQAINTPLAVLTWETVAVPSGWTKTLPFAIQRQGRTFRIDPAFSLRTYSGVDSLYGVDYYVDKVAGNDLSDGLTWGTALKSLHAAAARTNCRLINAKAGYYGWPNGLRGSLPYGVGIVGDGGQVICNNDTEASVWGLISEFVYWTDITGMTPAVGVLDWLVTDAQGHPTSLPLKATFVELYSSPGGFWYDPLFPEFVYVSTTDMRVPDTSVKVYRSGNVFTRGFSGSGQFGYFENTTFEAGFGTARMFRHLAFNPGGSNKLFMKNCEVRHNFGTYDNVDISGIELSILQNCKAYNGKGDGIDYGYLAGYGVQDRLAIEIDCEGYDFRNTVQMIMNASTAHEAATVLRIGGNYRNTYGPVIADVGGSRVWMLGSYCHDSLGAGVSGSGVYIDGTADLDRLNLEDCPVGLTAEAAGDVVNRRYPRFTNVPTQLAGSGSHAEYY